MNSGPFDALAAIEQIAGDVPPILPPVPGAPGNPDEAVQRPSLVVPNGGLVLGNPLTTIWEDFKAGLPLAGIYVMLGLMFLIGLVMLLTGSGTAAAVGRRRAAGERGKERETRAFAKGYDKAAKDLGTPA